MIHRLRSWTSLKNCKVRFRNWKRERIREIGIIIITIPKRHFAFEKTSKYCWLYGAYSHNSTNCKEQFRKDRHKENTTFTSKMDGSTAYCKNKWFIGKYDYTRLIIKLNLINNMKSSVANTITVAQQTTSGDTRTRSVWKI